MHFSYTLIDVRELDGEPLVASGELGDNILRIMARLRDPQQAVRSVVRKVAALPPGQRESAMLELLILSVLRRPIADIHREIGAISNLDIRDHPIFGPYFKRVEEESLERGRQEGRQEVESALLRKMMEQRIGAIPAQALERLASASPQELEDLGVRLLKASSLDDLLK